MQRPPPKKTKENNFKEKSSRDKAIEFAKNIPRPRQRQFGNDGNEILDYDPLENQDSVSNSGLYNKQRINEDLVNIEEEPYDEYGNTIKENELLELNNKHKQYADEIEKIKQMIL